MSLFFYFKATQSPWPWFQCIQRLELQKQKKRRPVASTMLWENVQDRNAAKGAQISVSLKRKEVTSATQLLLCVCACVLLRVLKLGPFNSLPRGRQTQTTLKASKHTSECNSCDCESVRLRSAYQNTHPRTNFMDSKFMLHVRRCMAPGPQDATTEVGSRRYFLLSIFRVCFFFSSASLRNEVVRRRGY